MPFKVSKPSLYSQRYTYTITTILSLGKIILSPCSRYIKEGLVYVTLASPSS